MSSETKDKDFLKFWENISLHTKDETLIILKGHLLLEDLMREYCASKMEDEKALKEAKLSYIQTMYLTKSLQKELPRDWLWTGLQKVNSLRNLLAHNLSPDDYERKRNEFIEFVKSNMDDAKIFNAFKSNYEQLAVAIFVIYSTLSSHLRFNAKSFLAALAGPKPDAKD